MPQIGWPQTAPVISAATVNARPIGAAAFAGPAFGYQSENPAPYLEWMRDDGPMLMNLLNAGTLVMALAGLSVVALVIDGLRPDPRPVADVFS